MYSFAVPYEENYMSESPLKPAFIIACLTSYVSDIPEDKQILVNIQDVSHVKAYTVGTYNYGATSEKKSFQFDGVWLHNAAKKCRERAWVF